MHPDGLDAFDLGWENSLTRLDVGLRDQTCVAKSAKSLRLRRVEPPAARDPRKLIDRVDHIAKRLTGPGNIEQRVRCLSRVRGGAGSPFSTAVRVHVTDSRRSCAALRLRPRRPPVPFMGATSNSGIPHADAKPARCSARAPKACPSRSRSCRTGSTGCCRSSFLLSDERLGCAALSTEEGIAESAIFS